MFSTEEQQTHVLPNTKSANCLKLDLQYKMSKKSEIKLLNAKIKKLKNKCKALREESKTDREMLSNLMNVTTHLQSKTNEGIMACKEVSTELLEKNSQLKTSTVNPTLNEMIQYTQDLAIESNCENSKAVEVKKQVESLEQILQSLPIDKNIQNKNEIYNIPTQRSITASLRTEANGEDEDVSLKNNMISARTGSQTGDSQQLKRANSISFSPQKTNKVRRLYSLQSPSPTKIQGRYIQPHGQNLFVKYIYAIICTVVLTIIFFTLFF